jgi:hypothetical protein
MNLSPVLLFDEGFTMAIDKTLKIIRKQTPIPLSTMPWVLYASPSNNPLSLLSTEMPGTLETLRQDILIT